MRQNQVMNLFPVPVYYEHCVFDYSKELDFLKNLPLSDSINDAAYNRGVSADTFLMRLQELKRIRDFFEIAIDTYVKNIYKSQTQLYITQCWLNVAKPGGYHPEHYHPNSIVSGVWYPEFALGEQPFIHFCNYQKPNAVCLNFDDRNLYNADIMQAPVKSGNLILFPSNLFHGVRMNQSDKDRYSISFNTWTLDDLGKTEDLTYCSINNR